MTGRVDRHHVIDLIYEAAVTPSRWTDVMGTISDQIGGVAGILFGAREDFRRTITTQRKTETFARFVGEGWNVDNPCMRRTIELNVAGFVTDQDMFTDEQIASLPCYEFYRREGIGFRAATRIISPSGDVVSFGFFRHQDKGPVPRDAVAYLDELRPHLARASVLSSRFAFEQMRAQVDAFQVIGLPAAVLNAGGRLFAANSLFEAHMPDVFQDRRTRIAIADPTADLMIGTAIESLSQGAAVQSIPLTVSPDRTPMILHVVPVRGAAYDVFTRASALLVVTPVDRGAVPTAEVLQGLFDLTPAEARVARGVGEARSAEDIAQAQGVSLETVRSQIKAVLAKTGLRRQTELVSLLAGTGRVHQERITKFGDGG